MAERFKLHGLHGRGQWLVAVGFFLALCLTGVFAYRVLHHRPPPTDEPIRGWMTIGYVAHAYRVPPHILYPPLGLPSAPPAPPDKRPLREVARAQNLTMDEVRARLMDAIIHARPPYPPPPPPPRPEDVVPSPNIGNTGGAPR